ncbi:DUF2620 family protein [Clostridium sp. Marseille-Q2269]|uniref:DUF2620 family protein n=1 Tax=Clostridium sp. Marseille-Q2269 TaxID=2942205 RepID=UPI002072D90D|nr:DUF2620 family protein [Clostridium sp. Marseille-Q2269]
MIKIMVGGQLDKAKVLDEIKKYPCEGISAEIKSDFEAAIAVKNGEFAGVDAPESGVYKHGYEVVHLGY